MLLLVVPERRRALEAAVAPLPVIPIEIDVHGSTLIHPVGGPWSANSPRRRASAPPQPYALRGIDGKEPVAQEEACAF